MAINERIRGAWSKAKRYLDALAPVMDYDQLEEQERWIARLEERIAQIEARLPTATDRTAPPPMQT
ncbi:hypothetical protein [Sphingomonas lycopersici]|uniref:Uncharacterized protein n=1 Tax=Sphingomonas lycopersici TaxID=2951807 RepID=A0AA42CVS4_9SPHN|nr:hypothetical protein [Sphingomonas lycopersici]MCW6536898.1 hypothetical protein [Sphingomonas lycopersici]